MNEQEQLFNMTSDFVQFGNYLLSKERRKNIKHDVQPSEMSRVHDVDLENFAVEHWLKKRDLRQARVTKITAVP